MLRPWPVTAAKASSGRRDILERHAGTAGCCKREGWIKASGGHLPNRQSKGF